MTVLCPCNRVLPSVSHNLLYLPKIRYLAFQRSPTRHRPSRPVKTLVRPRLVRYWSSGPHSEGHDHSHVRLGPFRQIQFPDTWKGRRAERAANELWASSWRTVPQIDNPLSFKIDDGHRSNSIASPEITREGIIFAKGDNQAERYWRLSHPISLTTRLRRFRSGIRGITWSTFLATFRQWLYSIPSKPFAFRRWLYGGPSLPLLAKFLWLISGPSKHPWKRRSRWVRWSVAWLGVFLTTTTVLVAFELEPAPLTERLRFIPAAARIRLDEITKAEREQAESTLRKKFRKLRTPDIYEKARLGTIFDRLLLACGLENMRWRLFIVEDPGNCPHKA